MRVALKSVVLFALAVALTLALMPANASAQEVLDRVVAVVNGRPLLQSEIDDEIRFESLEGGKKLENLTQEEYRKALNQLIEQELIRQQVQSDYKPTDEEIGKQIGNIREAYPNARSEFEWGRVLSSYGLTPEELRERVVAQLKMLHFVEERLRPTVHVDREEAQQYYDDVLVPAVKAKGQEPEPYGRVARQIYEILTQQKMNQVFDMWMSNLRSQSRIRIFNAASDNSSPTAQKPSN